MENIGDIKPRGKSKFWKFAIIGLTFVVVASVVSYLFVESRKALTVQSAAQKFRPWCSGSVVKLFGHAKVMALANSKDSIWDFQTVSDMVICSKQKSFVGLLFFSTTFDENQWLSNSSSGLTFQGEADKSPVFVSNGWVIVLDWVAKGARDTEGEAVQWISNSFGVGYRYENFPLLSQ